jgi:hypothetical protein
MHCITMERVLLAARESDIPELTSSVRRVSTCTDKSARDARACNFFDKLSAWKKWGLPIYTLECVVLASDPVLTGWLVLKIVTWYF